MFSAVQTSEQQSYSCSSSSGDWCLQMYQTPVTIPLIAEGGDAVPPGFFSCMRMLQCCC